MALTAQTVPGETPLSEQDVQGLKHPFIKTREELSVLEAQDILSGKEWALASSTSRVPDMLSVDYLQELHRRMLGDVWEWAGEIRPNRRNGQGVWGIGWSRNFPRSRVEAQSGGTLPMKAAKEEIEAFVESVGSMPSS